MLSKLEETIRNKQLYVPSSRFYEEVKVFTWQSGRVQAKKGFNDDLVMSLAIGAWLYDASGDYSKSSQKINAAMLNAFGNRKSKYKDTPEGVLSEVNHFNPFFPKQESKNNVKTNIKNAIKKSNIPKDMLWVLK